MADIPDDILEGCRNGDRKSHEELYRLVSPGMYGICLHYAGNENDAKDILQEGFIKVFLKIKQFSGKGSLKGWIRKIIVNTALEKYRGQMMTVEIDEKINTNEDIYYENIIDELSAEELIKLIQTLTPKYRIVFNLYAIEGYSHKEISKKLGISEGTSKSNLSRARAVLQEKVHRFYSKAKKADSTNE